MIDETHIGRAIVRYALRDLDELSETDVAVVGAGPSGLTASYYLAKRGLKVVLFERRFSFGGGIGPGGNMLPRIVFQKEALPILEEFSVKYVPTEFNLYVVDPAELIAKLASKAIDAGVRILLGANVEDVIIRVNPYRVVGVLWVWTPVQMSGLNVDPLYTKAKAVVDATGHSAEVINIVSRKNPELGIKIKGERSCYAEASEELVVKHTGRVIEGLYVTGVAVCTLHGLPRMGPIFGGMLMSGKKVAETIASDIMRQTINK